MNKDVLNKEVQAYINLHINADINKIALAKPIFENVSSADLAGQIHSKKKCIHKLSSWFNTKEIYYPQLLSIEQCSSEQTAAYKANLAIGHKLLDLTAGFGVDSFFFSKRLQEIYSCEINEELASINAHNSKKLGANNIKVIAMDGIELLKSETQSFDTIYIDPARRNQSNKVFKLKDCTPDVTEHLDFFLTKAKRVIIKTAPLLDISAGLLELKNVSEIHILSVKNECKELLWVIDQGFVGDLKIICVSLNEQKKTFEFSLEDLKSKANLADKQNYKYLYEPDVSLLKSGAFNLISKRYNLNKLHQQSQLYYSDEFKPEFLGRIFEIKLQLSINELKKEKDLKGNVIVRNFPEKAENLVKKYKITPTHDDFILFTKNNGGYLVIKAKILQHY